MRKELLKHIKRIVIKIGSGVISDDAGLNIDRIAAICNDVDQLRRRGYEIILVSSGAVAAGKGDLGIIGRPDSIPLKQAAAAIGQSRLMRTFKDNFRGHGYTVGQILLTRDDLANRRRFLNARNTLMTLLEFGIIPIVNENDSVVGRLRRGTRSRRTTKQMCAAAPVAPTPTHRSLNDRAVRQWRSCPVALPTCTARAVEAR